MALQHLRSSTADKRPTPGAMSDGQLAMNTNLVSPGLFLKDSNGDSVKVGPVHVGTTAPNATPGAGGQAGNSKGEQWLDTSSSRYVFKIWDGTAWRTEDGEFVNASGDTMTGALGIIAGTNTAPGVFFSGDTNTGIYSPGADQVAISTNGTGRLTVGTTAVSSTLAVDHPLGAVGTPSITFTGDLNTGIYSPAADTIAFVEGGAEAMRITSDGRLGLGNSSPGTLGGGAILNISPTGGGRIVIGSPNRYFYITGASGTEDLRFGRRISSDTADNDIFTISGSTGNVGIGTTSPGSLVHVEGGTTYINSTNSGGTSTPLQLSNAGSSGTSIVKLAFNNAGITKASINAAVLGNDFLAFNVGSDTERARIDSSGRLLVGTSTSYALGGGDRRLQVHGANASDAAIGVTRWSADSAAPRLLFGKARGSLGAFTAVIDGDNLGAIEFLGANGTDLSNVGASIAAFVDGDPFTSGDTTDLPSRLVFSTTADGASSPTEAMRITNDRVIAYNQPTPTSKSAAATLTITELKTGIIQYTGAVATLTLPTGTLMEGGFSGIYTNMAFEWSVINTGTGVCTIDASTAHTIVGSATVAISASARFVSRRTASNTFVSYRLS